MKKSLFLSVLVLFIFCGNAIAAKHFDTSTFYFSQGDGGRNPEAERLTFILVNREFAKLDGLIDKLDEAETRIFSAVESNKDALASAVKDASLLRLELLAYVTDDYSRQQLENYITMSVSVHTFKAYGLTPETANLDSAFIAGFQDENAEIRQKYGYAYKNIYSSFRTNLISALENAIRAKGDEEFRRQARAINQGKTVEQVEQEREASRQAIETRNKPIAGIPSRLLFGLNIIGGFLISFIMCWVLCLKVMKETNVRSVFISSLGVSGFSAVLFFLLYVLGIVGGNAMKFGPIVLSFLILWTPSGLRRKIFSIPGLERFKPYVSFGQFEPRANTGPGLGEGTHGSATWGSPADVVSRGHIASSAPSFALGRVPGLLQEKENRFRYLGHLVVCAPTGSGKGIGSVIPNLLEYPGSVFVLDLKGENYAVTAEQRQFLGTKTFKIDPFSVVGSSPSARFNPLDTLDLNNEDCISASAAMAGNLVMTEKAGEMNHWDESALNLIQGLILYVKTKEIATLGEVRRWLTASLRDVCPDAPILKEKPMMLALDFALAEMSLSQEAFGIMSRAANAVISKPEKERASIISTAHRHTAFLDDPRITEALSCSDFDMGQIKQDLMSIFVILPPSKLAQNARFVRLLLGSSLTALTSSEKQPPYKVAFFLDEFAQLGYVEQIETAISLLRGYGACFLIYIQDLSQLKGIYRKWQSFLANAAKEFYGTADIDTAKYVSESLGVKTIEQVSNSESKQALKPLGGTSTSVSETGRALLTPDEVMRLGPENPIVLISGEAPYLLRRLNYLSDAEYQGKYRANPYHS